MTVTRAFDFYAISVGSNSQRLYLEIRDIQFMLSHSFPLKRHLEKHKAMLLEIFSEISLVYPVRLDDDGLDQM